jgi:hypothetical protein
MNLTSCWIDKQERPLCFQISSFTSSRIKTEEEKVRQIPTIDFMLFYFFYVVKIGV